MTAPRKRRASPPLAVQATELALAVPQVVAHRLARMALAGPKLSPRDRKEFERMVSEKHAAFGESWTAMLAQATRAQQALATSLLRSFASAATGGRAAPAVSAARLQQAAIGVLGKGFAPVHRKAVANAKRLARTRLR